MASVKKMEVDSLSTCCVISTRDRPLTISTRHPHTATIFDTTPSDSPHLIYNASPESLLNAPDTLVLEDLVQTVQRVVVRSSPSALRELTLR